MHFRTSPGSNAAIGLVTRPYSIASQRGFTLLELLSAMVVMAMIMALASMSLSQFSEYSGKSGRNFEQRINRYLSFAKVGQLLEGTLDYYVKNNLGKNQLYFTGEPELMRLVSRGSWFDGTTASINYLSVEKEPGSGLFSLVLYQRPLMEKVFFAEKELPLKDDLAGIVVLSGAQNIEFEYLGIENLRQIYPAGTTRNFYRNLVWQSYYDGRKLGYIPKKLRINVDWGEGNLWPAIIDVKAQNFAKRTYMLDGS